MPARRILQLGDPQLRTISAPRPDPMVWLERSRSVRVGYGDESGAFSGQLQHELDHLDGILAVDRALDRNSFSTREEFLRRLAVGQISNEPRAG